MNGKIYFILHYFITAFIVFILFYFLVFFFNPNFLDSLINYNWIVIIWLFIIPVMSILWVKCVKVWWECDKRISQFLLLFFFSGIYIVVYFRIAVRNNWIK